MILQKLIMSGFKSFADKTEFEFHEGVTCVVGPNGCGKSNVVDAVKWVLGEQSVKALRGGQMQDMIFNGSSTRRSSGFAQVDLVFKNDDGLLKVEQTEVTVSRRLHRSGESEYLLNMQPCRLKDIKELFLDTGIGVDAYSVIEQGKVDVLLQSNPQERRIIFEEAAGISKYKARRREAERKLERTRQNLMRLEDIVGELEKRLRSVKLQAGKARNFKEYDRRLRELRAGHAMAEWHRLTQDRQRLKQRIDAITDQSVKFQADLSKVEADHSDLGRQMMELDQSVEQSTQEMMSLKSQITAFIERARSAEQRREEQQESLEGHRKHIEQERERITNLQSNVTEEQAKLPRLQEQLEEQSRSARQLAEQDKELSRTLADAQASLEDEKAGIIELMRQSAALHNQITELGARRNSLAEHKTRLLTRDEQIRAELEEVLNEKAVLERRSAQIEDLMRREKERLEEKIAQTSTYKNRRNESSRRMAVLKEKRGALLSERDLLQGLERRMEGVDAAVRRLLQLKATEHEDARLGCIHGIVADVITTDVEHAPLIEAALERWAQHLIVDDSNAFLELHAELGDLEGRLSILCADRLAPVMGTRDFSGVHGFVANAIDLVNYPEKLEYLTRSLLGRTIVVETFEVAAAHAREDHEGHVFISLKGEIADANGRLVLGRHRAQTGLISRKSRIRELQSKLPELEEEIRALGEELIREEAELDHLNNLIQDLRNSISENHSARVEAQTELQHAQETIGRLTRERPLIVGEVEQLEEQISVALERSSTSERSLTELQEQNERQEQAIHACQERIENFNLQRSELQKQVTESRVAVGQLAEKKAATQETIYALNAALESAENALKSHVAQIAACEKRIREAEQVVLDVERQRQARVIQLKEREEATLRLRQHREELRGQAEQLSEKAREFRRELSEVEERLHAEQMRRQEVEVRRDELSRRVKDELDIDLEESYASYSDDQQDWQRVEEEIKELKEKIARLGNVNLDALQEQEELEERLGFLVSQRDDLDESQRQLDALIKRLNEESQAMFTATFRQIRTQFQEMFRKLFGGGKADLILDETCEDVLEAGIDIYARPPGKELQNISLLSGGEKTMTAIAILLSIFKTKPSPFVLLDEVDAALDEANNERFNRMIKEFLEQSQFILITHSKRTMHIADTLYGVTMQEPGVSCRVSVHFDDHAEEPAVA